MTQPKLSNKQKEVVRVWKDVPGYLGLYTVSNDGQVKSFHNGSERILKPHICNRHKRANYSLFINGEGRRYKRARLVAMAFIPNPNLKGTVNHKNGDKLDDRVENLEWMSLFDNMAHAHKEGLFKKPDCWKKQVPVIQMTADGKYVKTHKSITEAAKNTGGSRNGISAICNSKIGKRLKADGSYWYYTPNLSGGYKWRI